jgi:hypothetical protein
MGLTGGRLSRSDSSDGGNRTNSFDPGAKGYLWILKVITLSKAELVSTNENKIFFLSHQDSKWRGFFSVCQSPSMQLFHAIGSFQLFSSD